MLIDEIKKEIEPFGTWLAFAELYKSLDNKSLNQFKEVLSLFFIDSLGEKIEYKRFKKLDNTILSELSIKLQKFYDEEKEILYSSDIDTLISELIKFINLIISDEWYTGNYRVTSTSFTNFNFYSIVKLHSI